MKSILPIRGVLGLGTLLNHLFCHIIGLKTHNTYRSTPPPPTHNIWNINAT